jgi:hypothetical protein
MPNPVVHFEIIGENQQLLESFYKEVFAWQITPAMAGYSLVAKEAGGIAGGIGAEGSTRRVAIYVSVPNIEAALAVIESKGGKMAFGQQTVPDGTVIAGFTDPEGNLIRLAQGPK